ncbi:hypothetical protein JTE90_022915 [Oedothorax gibbosus]|uniref:Uncharacterized protein n=1 Tax=Oedothorax gibbosus TaxID=931172 RepID=A0AAV6TEI6_9ARAC|nr:hypothetical protein JTE90_022915 [Oedothorax gibbosus]
MAIVPTVLEQPTPFMGSHERLASDAFNRAFGFHAHSASSALPKVAHLGTLILSLVRPSVMHRRTFSPI